MIRIFDIQNGAVVPTEHCYTIRSLKAIMDEYPENYLKIYQYAFYMTCMNPDLNPFFDVPDIDREELILNELEAEFSTEDEVIINAVDLLKKLYETPTSRAYRGIKTMLDRLADYMENTPIEHGRDGNINSLVNAAAKYQQIRESFKGAFRDLKDEQQSSVRGGQSLAYDQ
jgi:hypothetical protein